MKLLSKKISNYDCHNSLGFRFRSKRIAPLLQMIRKAFSEHGFVKIIDIGGTEQYWKIVPKEYLQKHNVEITIVNLPNVRMPGDHGAFKFVNEKGFFNTKCIFFSNS
jgi:hypothetical protein